MTILGMILMYALDKTLDDEIIHANINGPKIASDRIFWWYFMAK